MACVRPAGSGPFTCDLWAPLAHVGAGQTTTAKMQLQVAAWFLMAWLCNQPCLHTFHAGTLDEALLLHETSLMDLLQLGTLI